MAGRSATAATAAAAWSWCRRSTARRKTPPRSHSPARRRSVRRGLLRDRHALRVPLEHHERQRGGARVLDAVNVPGRGVDRVALRGREFLAVEVPLAGTLRDVQEL